MFLSLFIFIFPHFKMRKFIRNTDYSTNKKTTISGEAWFLIGLVVLFILVVLFAIYLLNSDEEENQLSPPSYVYKEITCGELDTKETFQNLNEYYSYFNSLLISEKRHIQATYANEDVSSYNKVGQGLSLFCSPFKNTISFDLYNGILAGVSLFPVNSKVENTLPNMIASVQQEPLTLLQGPPGTGKTYTTAMIIDRLLQINPTTRILVCCPSNGPLVELKEKYLQLTSSALPSVGIYYSTTYTNNNESVKDDPNNIRENINRIPGISILDTNRKYDAVTSFLETRRVLFVTCTSIMDPIFSSQYFDFIIIDEASRCIEPEAILPLLHAKENTNCLLVGDHLQLSPLVNREEIKPCLSVSLFKRLQQIGTLPSFTLTTQYRMHPWLAKLSYPYFYPRVTVRNYDEQCSTKTSCGKWYESRPVISNIIEYKGRYYPGVWVDVIGKEEGEGGFYNTKEADEIVDLVDRLLGTNEIEQKQITILVPYKEQAKEIVRRFQQKNKTGLIQDIQIRTIDSYQGNDNDVIILSLVRSNPKEEIGFLDNPERINVALTRAKFLYFIVGNEELFRNKQPYWSQIIRKNF